MTSPHTKQPVFFSDFMGFDVAQAEHGQAQVHYQPRPEHLNAFGVVHAMRAATVQMNTQFFAPAQGALTAHAHCLQRTATLAFAEVTLHGADGKPCAKASGTFKLVRELLPRNAAQPTA